MEDPRQFIVHSRKLIREDISDPTSPVKYEELRADLAVTVSIACVPDAEEFEMARIKKSLESLVIKKLVETFGVSRESEVKLHQSAAMSVDPEVVDLILAVLEEIEEKKYG